MIFVKILKTKRLSFPTLPSPKQINLRVFHQKRCRNDNDCRLGFFCKHNPQNGFKTCKRCPYKCAQVVPDDILCDNDGRLFGSWCDVAYLYLGLFFNIT